MLFIVVWNLFKSPLYSVHTADLMFEWSVHLDDTLFGHVDGLSRISIPLSVHFWASIRHPCGMVRLFGLHSSPLGGLFRPSLSDFMSSAKDDLIYCRVSCPSIIGLHSSSLQRDPSTLWTFVCPCGTSCGHPRRMIRPPCGLYFVSVRLMDFKWASL